ncbi:hypothetical protein DVA67_007475 [Solirubrobacter sp. CPCC 204708]|uniref:DUF3558 domain-containing protein n=1 Tax=Solirubrobacter deserti TaxID=2282478 RepID=A0ABT4RK66_9ACTN|nr:hypothetical protein [Solirubrobacter deserti]MBE2315811.1 hypothetical protein [Solirubrobacter deserti]MDA0138853.1 hypothetical protein [Solirubrobacter deserti]
MRIHTLAAVAATALLASAGVADAREPSYSPVQTEIVISDADSTAVKTLSCEWTDPQPEDMKCIRFNGDPQTAFREIEKADGVRADVTTQSKYGRSKTTYSRRGDNTWLVRISRAGLPFETGFVCTSDGQNCEEWTTMGGKSARKAVKAAAARL